jgi:hypothetical protein
MAIPNATVSAGMRRGGARWRVAVSLLMATAAGCVGQIQSPNSASVGTGPGGPPSVPGIDPQSSSMFECTDPSGLNATPLRRLSSPQLTNTLVDTFGQAAISAQASLHDIAYDMAIETPGDFRVNFVQSNIQTFLDLATGLASAISADPDLQRTLGGECLTQDPVPDPCLTDFITSLGLKVWRRPLTSDELSTIAAAAQLDSDKADKISAVLESLLQSPYFLYRVENGVSGDGSQGSPLELSQYEIASRLSYTLLDSTPDAALLSLAAAGKLNDPATLSSEVDRLMLDPRARAKLSEFAGFWLDLNSGTTHFMRNFPSSPSTLVAGIDGTALKAEVIREAKEFVASIAFDAQGTYADLMKSNLSFASTDALAGIYGHPTVTGSQPAQMTQGRYGLLMRDIFVATDTPDTDPVIRGVRTRSRIFCQSSGVPSAAFFTQGPNIDTTAMFQMYSTRQRYDLKTAGTPCNGCHPPINAVGALYENFDSFGRMVSVETDYDIDGSVIATHPIDTSSTINAGVDGTWTLSGAADLEDHLAASKVGPGCLAEMLFDYYQMTTHSAADNCALAGAQNAMSQPNGTLIEGLKKIILTNYLTQKRVN